MTNLVPDLDQTGHSVAQEVEAVELRRNITDQVDPLVELHSPSLWC